MREDDFTSTVDGARGHAMQFADDYDDDRPTLADVWEPPAPPFVPCSGRDPETGKQCSRRDGHLKMGLPHEVWTDPWAEAAADNS